MHVPKTSVIHNIRPFKTPDNNFHADVACQPLAVRNRQEGEHRDGDFNDIDITSERVD